MIIGLTFTFLIALLVLSCWALYDKGLTLNAYKDLAAAQRRHMEIMDQLVETLNEVNTANMKYQNLLEDRVNNQVTIINTLYEQLNPYTVVPTSNSTLQ